MSWATKIPARLIDFGNKILPINNYTFGIKLIASGGGSGTWAYIDENENYVDLPDGYFKSHPIYKSFVDNQHYTIDNNKFVRIPKFYIRTDGGTKFWISNEERDGFRCHPAFLTGLTSEGSKREYDYIYIGAYTMSKNNNDYAQSVPSLPIINAPFETLKGYCDNRNEVSGIAGYHMWNIYEHSAITFLAMLECKSTDFQRFYGQGRVDGGGVGMNSDSAENGAATANYHGIYGLWGNAWQFIDGVKSEGGLLSLWGGDGKQTYGSTDISIPVRASTSISWAEGVSCGYYAKLLNDVGARYNCSDLFLPDFSSLTGRTEASTFSDYAFCVTGMGEKVCAVGGDYDSGNDAGMFAYMFDVSPTLEYSNITSRLAKY